ncbi:hypothetical protein ACNOYE_22865 [Nannocystaceae bacterium ST9]
MIAGLCWFAVLAFTDLDSSAAKTLRVDLGLEQPDAVCQQSLDPTSGTPICTFDDRAQNQVEREWLRDRKIRAAVLHELDLRIEATLANLARAERILERETIDFGNGLVAGGNTELAELLELPDLRPISWHMLYLDDGTAIANPLAAASYDSFRDGDATRTQAVLVEVIGEAREQLLEHQRTILRQRERDIDEPVSASGEQDRVAMIESIRAEHDRDGLQSATIAWFEAGKAGEASSAAYSAARQYPLEFDDALDFAAPVWAGGWDVAAWDHHYKPRVRYASPITDEQRHAILGTLFLALASLMFLVVGPVVSATATAREREAGTLPVLRMTGMGPGDLALAMILGPNMFALAFGGALLLAGCVLIGMTAGPCALALPLAVLFALSAATHVSAIALGDALGQRVNAMVVGALVGVAVIVPGMIGTGLAALQITATGLLLGPLPAPLALFAEFSGVRGFGLGHFDDMVTTMFAYSLAVQAGLGLICMASWRRRVEQGWAPLFRPLDGVVLALASIGCSALTLLEVSSRRGTQDFDTLNALTFMANVFLLPLLGWLLVASLRRPARARAVASHLEAARGFLRFQGFVVATALVVGATYGVAMNHAGLASDKSELMWATLGQLLLLAETSAAILLWAARKREHKLRIAFIGGAVVLLQIGAMIGTYVLEVEHVARTNEAAQILLLAVDVSPYWMAFLVLCWAAGIALILTALHRNREEQRAAQAPIANEPVEEPPVDDEEDEEGLPGRRLIH